MRDQQQELSLICFLFLPDRLFGPSSSIYLHEDSLVELAKFCSIKCGILFRNALIWGNLKTPYLCTLTLMPQRWLSPGRQTLQSRQMCKCTGRGPSFHLSGSALLCLKAKEEIEMHLKRKKLKSGKRDDLYWTNTTVSSVKLPVLLKRSPSKKQDKNYFYCKEKESWRAQF